MVPEYNLKNLFSLSLYFSPLALFSGGVIVGKLCMQIFEGDDGVWAAKNILERNQIVACTRPEIGGLAFVSMVPGAGGAMTRGRNRKQ